MISVAEAREIIQANVRILGAVQCPLSEAAGLTLAEDVYATRDIPSFPQSSMDGYALSFNSWTANKEITIEGEAAAGDSISFELGSNQAARIFTGAAIPSGADTVVMQEKTRIENGKLIIEDEKLRQGTNVRPQGSEIKAGNLALAKGTPLTPAAIGFLAGIGISSVRVYPNPAVAIIVTGDELQQPGNPLQYGQVYDCNSFSLTAALSLMNIRNVVVERAEDDLHELNTVLTRTIETSDIVLLAGGVSAGDYDFVTQAAMSCGVRKLFHKVKQRPGKPLFFGTKENKPVFGLPGNPSSVLTCFYLYVIPALELLTKRSVSLPSIETQIAKTYKKDAGLTHLIKGYFDGKVATPLDAQESYRMRSFAGANCLIQLDEELTDCTKGSLVKVHLLPV
jgi:molybdopterin molybdotransferase